MLVKTGIEGLDHMLNGGIPQGQAVLLSGTAGTGKTILASQFIYKGATVYGEPGVYVSLEERPEDIKKNMANFGWDFDKLEKAKKVIFLKYKPFQMEDISESLRNAVREIKPKRIAIDSVTGLALHLESPAMIRHELFELVLNLKDIGCTAIFTSEIPAENQAVLSKFGVEEFLTDGVIALYYNRTNGFSRALTVWKMRGVDHDKKVRPYKITKDGIVVYSKEEAIMGK